MPGPEGTITINGDRKIACECKEGGVSYAESSCIAKELKNYMANVDPADMTPLGIPTMEFFHLLKFNSSDDTK